MAEPAASRRPLVIGCALAALVGLCLSGFVAQYVFFHQGDLFPGDPPIGTPASAPTPAEGGGGCEFPPFS